MECVPLLFVANTPLTTKNITLAKITTVPGQHPVVSLNAVDRVVWVCFVICYYRLQTEGSVRGHGCARRAWGSAPSDRAFSCDSLSRDLVGWTRPVSPSVSSNKMPCDLRVLLTKKSSAASSGSECSLSHRRGSHGKWWTSFPPGVAPGGQADQLHGRTEAGHLQTPQLIMMVGTDSGQTGPRKSEW